MFKVGVLASGSGTNLQAILDTVHGHDDVQVVGVLSNNPNARALQRANESGVEGVAFPKEGYADRIERDKAMADWLKGRKVDLVVLAGYMELVSAEFLKRFSGAVINVHPALLPAFPGLNAIEKQLEYGVKVSGVTIHLVDEGIDTGPIILQEAFPATDSRDVEETLQAAHMVEHRLLPEAIRLFARGAISIDDTNPRIVHIGEDG